MQRGSVRTRFAIQVVGPELLLAGCANSPESVSEGPIAALGTTSNINPREVSELRDGGNLRLSLTALPENWNSLHTDASADVGAPNRPMMPRAFSTSPQVVGSDGNPIIWEDIRSQANALSGADTTYLIKLTTGFDRVAKVERGIDDRQAIITFKQHHSEWKGQFAGNFLLFPKSVTETPEAFHKSLRGGILLTADPFQVQSIDPAPGRVVLNRNPTWWRAKPKFDTITFSVLADEAVIPALHNNEIDAVGVSTIDDMKTARTAPAGRSGRARGNSTAYLLEGANHAAAHNGDPARNSDARHRIDHDRVCLG